MIYFLVLSIILGFFNLFLIFRIMKSITTIIGPKLDEQDKKYMDLIKKLKKIL